MTRLDPRPATPAPHLAPPPWRSVARTRVVLAVVLVELIVAAMVVYGLWALRRQVLDSELRTLGSLSAAMATQADGTLDVADAVLRATRTELVDGLMQPGTAAADALLHARVAALPKFHALLLFDADGRRVAGSHEGSQPPAAVVAREYFIAARANALAGAAPALLIGRPHPSGTDGKPGIAVAMDWRDARGVFQGVIVLEAAPEFLDGGFERIAPTADTSLAIYRRDRELVSDGPGDGVERLLPAHAMDQVWADPNAETPRRLVLPDGRQRLVAAHRLQRFPLMVVVTRDARVAMADWSDQAWLVGSFAASALAMTLFLTLRNGREQALRRASQSALAAEQERAIRAFQAAQEGHWEWNPQTGQSHLSPRMKELLGIARDAGADGPPASSGLLARASLHPDDVGPLRAAFEAHQLGRTPAFDWTFRVRQADGAWRHVRARGTAWRDAAGQAVLFSGTASDVSVELQAQQQQLQLHDQLQRARKLEALGTLAGGVAHDFNNILAAVIGYTELARGAAPQGSAQARQIDQVMQAGLRGKALVERILSFSRSSPRPHLVFRPQPVVDEVLQLLAGALPPAVQLVRRLEAAEASISGDATMVFEAAMNLCANAIQAMQGQGGSLLVELSVVDAQHAMTLYDSSLAAGRYVCLSVSDTGPGIAPDVRARLFEPFFTTKGPQQGTGLGLAIVHGAVHDMGGAIDVQSTLGAGTRFALYFPGVDAVPNDAPVPAGATPLGTGQTVLVVDDEAALVALTEELLAELGYESFGLSSSTQALAEFQADPDRFDLVLTDERMPDMDGTTLATALRAVRPDLPVVLVSGYGGPQLGARALAAGVAVVLHKPLVRAELAEALARALGTHARAA